MNYCKLSAAKPRFLTGFTLIEFLLYIALVGIVFTIGLEISLNVLFASAKAKSIEAVAANARSGIDMITHAVRNANLVTTPSRGVDSPILSLNTSDPQKNPTVFSLSGNTLMITEGTAPAAALTSPEVEVTTLTFKNVSYPGEPDSIRLTIAIAHKNPSNRPELTYQQTFLTTVTVRKQ